MSLETFFATVETDIEDAVKDVEGGAETALTWLWSVAKPVFTAAEPVVLQGLLNSLIGFLTSAAQDIKGGASEDIETAFLNFLSETGHELLTDAQNIGSNVLQMLIGLAKGKLAPA